MIRVRGRTDLDVWLSLLRSLSLSFTTPQRLKNSELFSIMRIYCYLFTVVPTAVAQFTTSVEATVLDTTISESTSTHRQASLPTISIAIYTPRETTIDSWLCATKNVSDYLSPPMPTGKILDIYYNHSDKIYKECEDKLPKPFTTFPACPSVAKASWCAVSEVKPGDTELPLKFHSM